MGRNPVEIETYLKEFDRDRVIDANQHLYITSTDAYKEARKKKQEKRAAAWAEWEAKREERFKAFLEKTEITSGNSTET